MTFYNEAGLDITNMPPSEERERYRVGNDEIKSGHPRLLLHHLMRRHVQPVTERLAKLERVIRVIRTSIEPAYGAVALIVAVMLGGFTWLSTDLHRIEAKVDAVSLRLAQMPGTLEGDLQAQTERLTALISVHRQSGSAAPPGGGVAPTPGAGPAPSHARSVNLSQLGVAAAASSVAPRTSGQRAAVRP